MPSQLLTSNVSQNRTIFLKFVTPACSDIERGFTYQKVQRIFKRSNVKKTAFLQMKIRTNWFMERLSTGSYIHSFIHSFMLV